MTGEHLYYDRETGNLSWCDCTEVFGKEPKMEKTYDDGFYLVNDDYLWVKTGDTFIRLTGTDADHVANSQYPEIEFHAVEEWADTLLDDAKKVSLTLGDTSPLYPLRIPMDNMGYYKQGVYLSNMGHLVVINDTHHVIYFPSKDGKFQLDSVVTNGLPYDLNSHRNIAYADISQEFDKYLIVKDVEEDKDGVIQAQLGVGQDGVAWLRVGDNCIRLGNLVYEGTVGMEKITDRYNIKWAK